MTVTAPSHPKPACLKSPTDDRWLDAAMGDLPRLLADHAHCEEKAAATALSLVARYPDDVPLVTSMLHLAQEELGHFTRLVQVLRERDWPLGRIEPDRYVKALLALNRVQGVEHVVDRLLILSLVEARSCERMGLLAEHLPDPDLQPLYHDLAFTEAGHHQLFVSLACHYLPKEAVTARLEALSWAEADIVRDLTPGPRMH